MKEWDRKNMKSLAVNLKRNEAEAFQRYAEEHNTKVAALLRGYIQATLSTKSETQEPSQPTSAPWGVEHIISYKNTDRLKREAAFHNPNNLSPDKLLNEILDRYFDFVEQVRK